MSAQQQRQTVGASVRESVIRHAIAALYREADVPSPSVRYPVTPLGPLMDGLTVLCRELPELTSRSAERYLLTRGSITEPLGSGIATDERLSGFLYATEAQACVLLRKEDPVVRRRFSLAHELGHLRLHVPAWLDNNGYATGEEGHEGAFHDLFTREQREADGPAVNGEAVSRETAHLRREREADRFAAMLLMPEAVARPLSDIGRREGFAGEGLAERLAMEMLVSRSAMRRRLVALGILAFDTAPEDWKEEEE